MRCEASRQAPPRSSRAGAACGLALLVALGYTPAARAHDMWIAPSTFRPAAGEVVRLYLQLGEAGGEVQAVERDSRRIERFDMVGPGGRSDVPGLDGQVVGGWIRPPAAGRHAVAYVTRPAFSELPAAAFESYLAEEGLEAIIEERRELRESGHSARERYSRSLKTLIDAGDATEPDRPVGLPLELILEGPTEQGTERSDLGAAWRVRLILHDEPLEHALVRARRLDHEALVVLRRTDAEGRATLDLGPGRWVVSSVYMERSEEPGAEWRSLWTSLAFEIPEQGGGPVTGRAARRVPAQVSRKP